MMARMTPWAVAMGKSEPETIHMGTSSRFMMAWKPAVDSILQAITKPRPVRVKEIRNMAAATGMRSSGWMETPASGAKARKMRPWIQASVAEPRILPSTILVRGAGDTSREEKEKLWGG